ncbi:N-acetylglucosamine-6-phosphate deacetylase [uncultured Cohaesibacter sp.]|uniref:N-acetylglucosamine-6-phosphate deacetylase n=1 Tax=uncultured Cohaesibacter sp. TaxID=1002546 RepID=UPI002930AF4E|nr:N-acetylglucosamine-6-phosphate deacetylase [uncultured Cohaesibacter sp.]
MSKPTAYIADLIFDGTVFHQQSALLVEGGKIVSIASRNDVPSRFVIADQTSHYIVPGFVDLQVNGGGGALFNDNPTIEGIRIICSAHARFGTTALLPTLITDTAETRDRALAAGKAAFEQRVPGYLGLHLEGPHLSIARKGCHLGDLIRPLDQDDVAALQAAVGSFGIPMITLAPENVLPEQIASLADGGWKVSLGHTDCKGATALDYFEAGASLVTHLFNAMSQLANREPGLVGAALASDPIHCGMIVDGFHVDVTTMKVALSAKKGPGKIFFVTDAMSPTGTDATQFELFGRTIYRRDGRLTLEDGTLAGADIDMNTMVKRACQALSLSLEEALRMASLYPAQAIGATGKGHLKAGADADFLFLDQDLTLGSTWIAGSCAFETGM